MIETKKNNIGFNRMENDEKKLNRHGEIKG